VLGWVVAIAIFGSAVSASAGDALGGTVREVHRTARVTYYAPKGRAVDVKRTEAFLDKLATVFGPAPTGWRLEYHLHGSATSVHADLGAAAYGITDLDRLRIDSVRAYHPHELVHAVAGRFGRAPLLFEEGMAVALTSGGRWGGRAIDDAALAALDATRGLEPFLSRFTEQDPDAAYAVAGSLVAYLLDLHGMGPFLAFVQGCGADGRGFERSFRRAYGRSLARVGIEWQRLLREGPQPARAWYDPSSWPRSLDGDANRVEAAALGASPAAPAGIGDRSGDDRRTPVDAGRVLAFESAPAAAEARSGDGAE
jgi:hypothetical protein